MFRIFVFEQVRPIEFLTGSRIMDHCSFIELKIGGRLQKLRRPFCATAMTKKRLFGLLTTIVPIPPINSASLRAMFLQVRNEY